VRSGGWKLLRWFGNPDTHELYNLASDLGESNDLAAKMPDKVKELGARIDRFLKDTGVQYPRPNPAYRPVAAKAPGKAPAKADPLEGWKERQCKATPHDGILNLKATGKPGTAFLGHAMAKMQAPAVMKLRLRSQSGGTGKVDCFPNGSADETGMSSTPFEVAAGDWQDITVSLTQKGPLRTLRLYLPDCEIDSIEVAPKAGATARWNF
jgi:hypothetical protein